MTQTAWVAERLRAAAPDLAVEIHEFRTAGDRDRSTPLARMSGVGFFVKELEVALLEGKVDLAVHSMKDVPSRVPEGLVVGGAVPEREDPRECLVTLAGVELLHLPQGALVGTSSPRRRAMLASVRPDLAFTDLRGNVETRLRRLEEGVCAATVLARAGLSRLGMLDRRMSPQSTDVLTPPAGQGALGLEHRADDAWVRDALAALDHAPSRLAVTAERACMRRLGAGCQTPIGILGRMAEGGRLVVVARLLSPDGREVIQGRAEGPPEEADALGTALADRLLADGAARLVGSVGRGAEGPGETAGPEGPARECGGADD
jgi:hydroxymethylbilane synthase